MRSRTLAVRIAAVLTLGAMLLPGVATADHSSDEECFKREGTFARFIEPASGQLSVQTGIGSISYTVGSPVPTVVISTTGSVDVTFEYACLLYVQLDAFKKNPDGTWTHFHSNGWNVQCEHGTKTDAVPIGLDGGEYRFRLSGEACNGQPLRETENGGVVGDPPLL